MATENSYLEDPLFKLKQQWDLFDSDWEAYKYRQSLRKLDLIDPKTAKENDDKVWNLFKNSGIWVDYNGPDTNVKTVTGEGDDKQVKYNWGAIGKNVAGNFGRIGGTIMSAIKDKETANNSVNDYATNLRKTFQLMALASGNPYLMAASAISKLSDVLGGTASATRGLGLGNDIGNFMASQVPFLGFLGRKMDKQFLSNELSGSSMYSWSDVADGLDGNIAVGASKAEKLKAKNNIQRSTATNKLRDAKLDFIGALDPRYYWAAQDELNKDLRYIAKNGAVLQFTKRTLSKQKVKKNKTGGKVNKTDELVDNTPDKLSRITLDLYLQQKRQAWIEKAIQKASTRNAPYMFKNKDWKNCIATAFDSYGLYDKNGMPLVIRNADFALDPNKYGFAELQFGDSIDTLPDGVLIQDYNNPKDRSTPGHAIILTGRDENEVPIYSWSSGNNEIEDMHPQARLYSFYWTDKVKPRAYQFIGTPEQIEQWINEYKQMYNLSDNDIEAFKEGGKVNVIPSGALHAHKHHLTEKAEDGEKFEDVTTKGIPVVVEDEKGNLIQQAEVEREEIIFRLEVTKRLEELSKKHTDEAAIEAGKLLVKEILYNTEDNTGEML